MYPIVGRSASHGGRGWIWQKERGCVVIALYWASPWGSKRVYYETRNERK